MFFSRAGFAHQRKCMNTVKTVGKARLTAHSFSSFPRNRSAVRRQDELIPDYKAGRCPACCGMTYTLGTLI
jgi:hypothetical protein